MDRSELKKRVLIVATEDGHFCAHMLDVAKKALASGYIVAVATTVSQRQAYIENFGIKVFPMMWRRASLNVLGDITTLVQLASIMNTFRPHIVHNVGNKPMLYGSLVSKFFRVDRIINSSIGMGQLYTGKGAVIGIARRLFLLALRIAFSPKKTLIAASNADDQAIFRSLQILPAEQIFNLSCVGVDLSRFKSAPEPEGTPIAMMAERMVRSKGVPEFVEAAKRLKARGVKVRMVLVGAPDLTNPTSLTVEELKSWVEAGFIEWWGRREDMEVVWQRCHIGVSPSHREGLGLSQLEVAASNRPMVSTDVPGTREFVIHEHNGLLVPLFDVDGLANAIQRLVENPDLRQAYARAAYDRVVKLYDGEIIAQQNVDLYSCAMI